MKSNLKTAFQKRQYMTAPDFELYYYGDQRPQDVSWHAHDFYEFYFFLEGAVAIETAERAYLPQFGDLLLFPPHLPHRLRVLDSAVPYRRFVFWVDAAYGARLCALSEDYRVLFSEIQPATSSLAPDSTVSAGPIPSTDSTVSAAPIPAADSSFPPFPAPAARLFHNDRAAFYALQARLIALLEELHTRRFGRATALRLGAEELLFALSRLVYEQTFAAAREEERSLLQSLCAYLEAHLTEPLSLGALAERFFVSKYYIAHLFKEQLGVSVHQYLLQKRLSLCREAIGGGMASTEACASFGFGDYSAFYRAFRKAYGLSPKQWQALSLSDPRRTERQE